MGWWSSKGKGSFGSEFGAAHCNQCRLCGVVVRKCMNWSSCHLGWWVGVSQGTGVLDRGPHASRDGNFRSFSPHWFEWRIFWWKCTPWSKFLFHSFFLNIVVKKLRKSINICQSYRKNKSGTFFMDLGVFDSCMENWYYFRTDSISLEMSVHWLSEDIVSFKI